MRQRLLNLLTALSLLLCVAVVALQVHAYVAGRSRIVLRETNDEVYLAEIGTRYIRVMSTPPRDEPSPQPGVRRVGGTRTMLDLPLRVLTVVSGALPAVWFNRWLRRVSARSDNCPSCGHDLAGNVSGVCPECGGETS